MRDNMAAMTECRTGPDVAGVGYPGEVIIDLDAYRANLAVLRGHARAAAQMAVVKADAYGHGLIPVARAAVQAGVDLLGVAQLSEALTVRAALPDIPLMTWIWTPGTDLSSALRAGLDLGVSDGRVLDAAAAAARATGRPATVHLKIDTGLGRAGCTPAGWNDFCAAARRLEQTGLVQVAGIWSHLACADEPGHPANTEQRAAFDTALGQAHRAGLRPRWQHLANSAALLTDPATHHTLVRPGIATFGLSPVPQLGGPEHFGLRPVMTLRARLTLVKQVGAGTGVSYGHTYRTERDTTLALVPLGYSDGIPRHASGTGPVQLAGLRTTVAGRVCMDQFVIDLGPGHPARAGDVVTLFGPEPGQPSAQDWAQAAGTITYEIVTRLGGRLPRRYVGADPREATT